MHACNGLGEALGCYSEGVILVNSNFALIEFSLLKSPGVNNF